MLVVVEGEDGHVDLGHDGAEERGGFDRREPLLLQYRGERVDFAEDGVERIVGAAAAGANRIVALLERGHQIGESLQGAHHPLTRDQAESEPQPHDRHANGPAYFARIAAVP